MEEVAAIFVGTDGAPPSNKDIVVYPRAEEPHRVSELSQYVDPMAYILLFPRGVSHGWHPELQHHCDHMSAGGKRTRLTILQFYSPPAHAP